MVQDTHPCEDGNQERRGVGWVTADFCFASTRREGQRPGQRTHARVGFGHRTNTIPEPRPVLPERGGRGLSARRSQQASARQQEKRGPDAMSTLTCRSIGYKSKLHAHAMWHVAGEDGPSASGIRSKNMRPMSARGQGNTALSGAEARRKRGCVRRLGMDG